MVEDGIEHPSYFEFLFGMGMTAFAETDVEYIILETGLGGRLDATNAVDNPALCHHNINQSGSYGDPR